jgi:methylated-DNA-[protein]-cysteine S-methyltransferase
MDTGEPERWSAKIAAPFGVIGILTDGEFLVRVHYLRAAGAQAPVDAVAREACRQVQAYLRDSRFRFDLPLGATGTDHQQRVWRAMTMIPAGQTLSYGALAAIIGSSARAVGQACGANPLPLVVPCHRVVAADSSTGGFMGRRGGFALSVKRWLIAHERG